MRAPMVLFIVSFLPGSEKHWSEHNKRDDEDDNQFAKHKLPVQDVVNLWHVMVGLYGHEKKRRAPGLSYREGDTLTEGSGSPFQFDVFTSMQWLSGSRK